MANQPQMNNNPLNLRDANQRGELDPDKNGYARFRFPWIGWRAAHRQIELDQARGLTVMQFIFKFAPPSENNSEAYLSFVCHEMNVQPTTPLKALSKYALAGVMAQMEGYYNE